NTRSSASRNFFDSAKGSTEPASESNSAPWHSFSQDEKLAGRKHLRTQKATRRQPGGDLVGKQINEVIGAYRGRMACSKRNYTDVFTQILQEVLAGIPAMDANTNSSRQNRPKSLITEDLISNSPRESSPVSLRSCLKSDLMFSFSAEAFPSARMRVMPESFRWLLLVLSVF
ncbi:MAG: hypothetical protein ACK58T_49200, partial [Phycisphaerae bacterium]